ncbi:MAG: glucose-6-phosphate isomerase, partial [Gammaproteobacteria bacterium]|nr:glucose-6-phosphate isomerase [Gammaproteobacteria bacterium]
MKPGLSTREQAAVDRTLAAMPPAQAVQRLLAMDPGLWPASPAAEIRNRLGWLSCLAASRKQL